jgi:hypothetical protein
MNSVLPDAKPTEVGWCARGSAGFVWRDPSSSRHPKSRRTPGSDGCIECAPGLRDNSQVRRSGVSRH